MPLELLAGPGDAIGIDELIDTLDADPFNPRDLDDIAARAPLLSRLGRNRSFLTDLAIAELKHRCASQAAGNLYGPQVFMLRPPNDRYILRANFWPAASDAVVRASGPTPFSYAMPHDHNFSFLTVGYVGPGYWSDYYVYDGDAVVGLPGEDAGLRFVERSRLSEGRQLLYRAHHDVHAQAPPDSFSVSLNILAVDPAQQRRSQFWFDLQQGTIAEAITTAPGEVLAMLQSNWGAVTAAISPTICRGTILRRGCARPPSPRSPMQATKQLGNAPRPTPRPRWRARHKRGWRTMDPIRSQPTAGYGVDPLTHAGDRRPRARRSSCRTRAAPRIAGDPAGCG